MKIKETVTALVYGDSPSAVRTRREEKSQISDERFKLALQCIVRVAVVVGVSTTLINIGIAKLAVVLVFWIFYTMLK